MKKAYFTARQIPETGRHWWDYPLAEASLAKTVFEPDRSPVFTGLYDAHGVKIYRTCEAEPIGFVVGGRE